jgi:hypothetical protein
MTAIRQTPTVVSHAMRERGTRVFSRSRMTAGGSLTPALALAYLRELSIDVRAAVVLDAAGQVLAGDAALAPSAREALGAGGRIVRCGGDLVVAARAADGAAIAVAAGPRALPELLAHDVAAAARDLAAS